MPNQVVQATVLPPASSSKLSKGLVAAKPRLIAGVRLPVKVAFTLLVICNAAALFLGLGRFFVTVAEVGQPHVYFEGVEYMRNYLSPSLKWIVGIAVVNLAFAAFAVFRRRQSAT